MRINDLLNVSLDKAGVKLLVSLPEPQKSPLVRASSEQLLESCKTFRKLWGELVIQEIVVPGVELRNLPKDMIIPRTDEEIWDSLFLTITYYYHFSFLHLLQNEKHDELPAGLNVSSIGSFIPSDKLKKANKISVLRILSFNYFMCLTYLYFSSTLGKASLPSGFMSQLLSNYHKAASSLYQDCMSVPPRNRNAALILLGGILKYAEDVFSEHPYDKEFRPGVFSSIKTEELSLLASRDPEITKRYGQKVLEKVFERQLALIMQSFGMYVVSTKMGIRTVDLICISSFPDQKYTFLVEAKTTNKPYSLPRKDFRALKEYVDDVRHTLHTLPALRFVLISAYKPSRTLRNKLRDLQAETGVPVRFISSKQISDLRENVIGPLPSDVFADKVLSSPYILEDGFASEIIKGHIAMHKAHTDFIETIFRTKGIIPDITKS